MIARVLKPSVFTFHLSLVALLIALLPASASGQAASRAHPAKIRGDHFVTAEGEPVFLVGVNYEGPAEQAWQMWDDANFDPSLIARDMARARIAGLSAVRVFLQRPLAQDIRAGRWAKLDQVVHQADQYHLKLIFTFADYTEWQLANLITIGGAVAARYRARESLFAYDLKNEPRFGDLALTEYPRGTYVALQDPVLVTQVGETIHRSDIRSYRASEQGEQDIPTRLTDDQAYVYANVLGAYRRFLQAASAWARTKNSTTVRYLLSDDSAGWSPLLEGLNETLATWIKPQLDAMRQGAPEALVTIGHVDPIIASLMANNLLDYRAFHRYPSASSAGIQIAMVLFDDVRAAIPGKPMVMGEFGFSNASLEEERSAQLEADMVHAVRQSGGAGALKWMLNDFPLGFNPRENAFGMYRGDGTPKPVVRAFQTLGPLEPRAQVQAWPEDYDVPGGRFFTQTNGRPYGADPSGYAVTNADDILFWDAWQSYGLDYLGYPLSTRFIWKGLPTQVFQKAALQWTPDGGIALINLMDELHDQGADGALRTRWLTPLPQPPRAGAAQTWDDLVRERTGLLDANLAIKERYFAASDPLLLYGLPTSGPQDLGDVVALRTQRAVFQQWKINTPWAQAGEVTLANAGEIAQELRLFPLGALIPEPPLMPVPRPED